MVSNAPRNTTIRSYGDIDDLQEGPGFFELSCDADCNPECDRYKIYHNGALLNESKDSRIKKDRRNAGRYQCAASNSVGNRFQNSTNSLDIDIKYAPGNVSIFFSSDNGDMQEGNGSINITCYADCNPECDGYFIHHNDRRYQTKEKRIIKDRINSGLYKCDAVNSLGRSVNITVILESNKKELAINISDILPRDVSCRTDCNFPGCDSEITVKRDSHLYRTIRSREGIFENRAVERSDGGTYVCMVGTRVSGNNFKLIIYRKSKSFNFFVFRIDLVNV
uniref:B-cell receptor CD22 n=1 Tax=Magallana gigas TaxID=29159 RepID=K1PU64_MAGGI